METIVKKLLLTLALCVVPTIAGATYLAIPPLKPKPATTEAQMTCLEDIAASCAKTHRRSQFLRKACVRLNLYQCRQ